MQNHDLLKMWFEDMAEPIPDRCIFGIRFIRWLASLSILYIMTYLIIDPQDNYFDEQCHKRLECYNACNKAFFPMLKCQQLDMGFYYNHNLYERLYEFEKPDPNIWGTEALDQYKACKGYV
jgi:hypothetical protein